MAKPGIHAYCSQTRYGPIGCPISSTSLQAMKECPINAVLFDLGPQVASAFAQKAYKESYRSTRPFALRMRAFSSGAVGLWSVVRSIASQPRLPSRPSTPRESPTQAVVSVLPCGGSVASMREPTTSSDIATRPIKNHCHNQQFSGVWRIQIYLHTFR